MNVLLWIQDRPRLLSPSEKIAAIRNSLRDEAMGFDELQRAALWLGGVLVALGLAFLVALRVRRFRAVRTHLGQLRLTGLMDGELALFRQVAGNASLRRLDVLSSNRRVYDQAAGRWLHRVRSLPVWREALGSILALRCRLPFERGLERVSPPLEPGSALTLALPDAAGKLVRVTGYVLGQREGSLQIGLMEPPKNLAPLVTGRLVTLVARHEGHVLQTTVRVRGQYTGRRIQVLVDRPVLWNPTAVRVTFRRVDETARVELVERFPENFRDEHAPSVTAAIEESCSEGVLLSGNLSLRPGESLRISSDHHGGVYYHLAQFRGRGRKKLYFLVRHLDPKPAWLGEEPPVSGPVEQEASSSR